MENQELNLSQEKNNNKTKKLVLLITTALVFVILMVLIFIVFRTPQKVNFRVNGVVGYNFTPCVIDDEGKVTPPNEKTLKREHYDFLGWFLNADGAGEKIDFSKQTFDKTSDVYAIWEPTKYEITYNLDGGEFKEDETYPVTYTVIHEPTNKEKATLSETGKTIAQLQQETMNRALVLKTPTKDGYKFLGWEVSYGQTTVTIDDSEVFLKNIRVEPVGNITLKAIWE